MSGRNLKGCAGSGFISVGGGASIVFFSRRAGRVANTKAERVSTGRRLSLYDYTRMYDVLHMHVRCSSVPLVFSLS